MAEYNRLPWEGDEELSEEDLSFLSDWENAGKDADEHESLELADEGHGEVEIQVEGDAEGEIVGESENKTEGEGESDDPDSGESDEVDDSKMDISQVEDEITEENIRDKMDEVDPEFAEDDQDGDHLEGDDDEDHEIQDGEDDLEYDGDDDTDQVEEDDGEGERGNSDEKRESDEPINSETDSEQEQREIDEELEEREQEINADADEDFEGDAQQELEDHLKENQQDKPEDEDPQDEQDDEGDEAPPEKLHDKQDSDEKSEPEPLVEQPDENQDEGEDQHSGKFENLPEAGDLCTNHCEDNPPEESLDETCPHCMERIRNERELHGAIATDMHGKDVLPGDKLHVRIPIGMIAKDSIVTANVPNMEVDPERLAITTVGKRDKERCWLSGKGVSNFTGWRMTDVGNSVWTFKKGAKITFAEKIAQPLFDELDPEKMFEQLSDELDNYGKEEGEDDEKEAEGDSEEPEVESDSESDQDEDSEVEDDQPKDLGEHREKRNRDELTATQKKRFENLTERNWKKILNTFGSTIEAERLMDIVENGNQLRRSGSVVSRGVLYTFGFVAGKASDDVIEEIQQWHKDRKEDDAA